MKAGVNILIAYKMDFKEFKDRRDGYFIIIKESIHQEDNIHRLKIKLPKTQAKTKR